MLKYVMKTRMHLYQLKIPHYPPLRKGEFFDNSFFRGGILDSPPLKKGDLGGLSVIIRSRSTRHVDISTYAVFLLSLKNLPLSAPPCPLPSREGRFMKFPLPLWERVRERGLDPIKNRGVL
jgi:hypothetical protein